jgi:hypothetical protein
MDKYLPVAKYQDSADAGCMPCKMLLSAIESFKPGWLDTRNNIRRCVKLQAYRRSYWFAVLLMEARTEAGMFRLRRPHGDPSEWSFSVLEAQTDVVSSTSSDAAISKMKKWLSKCLNEHKNCKIPDHNFVPSRLIHVGALDGSKEPFLVERGTPCPYVALSYCWGSNLDGVLTTTKKNLVSHREVIPLRSLPQTLQDAILVSRGIGIEYVWVDYICIVQDDEEDWFRQSGQMSLIYSNSCLTISAEGAESCKMGFLGEHKYGQPGWKRPGRVGCPRDEYLDVVEKDIGQFGSITMPLPPLLTRGWCTQESVLPIRKLRLTGDEMIWVCNDGFQCECGHWEWDSDKDNEAEYPWIQRQYKPSFYNLKTDFMSNLVELGYDKWSPYEDWRYVITLFSRTKLTYERDTLSAVSGLAQVVQRATERLNGVPDRYLAGLWENDLARGLAWKTLRSSHVDVKHKRPLTYRAPSWSWASLDGPITWSIGTNMVLGGEYEVQNELTVSEAHCNALSSFDLTGQVSSGFIILTGHLAPVQLVRKGETSCERVWDIVDKNFEVVPFSCDFSEEISSQDLDSASAG